MRACVYVAPGAVEVRNVPDPRIEAPTDAVVRITRAAVCGSDLWFFRGINPDWRDGWRTGHEFIGVVDAVGAEVIRLRPGDAVIAPFAYSDGTCEHCRAGLHTSCVRGGMFGGSESDGGQAEAARVPFADATLVAIPRELAEAGRDRLGAALLLTDVLPTGHHGAVRARIGPGRSAAVIGDGAVGLCAVAAAARLGAERVVAVGHHHARLELARRLGATDVVDSADPDAVEQIVALTGGGCHSVVEAVGNQPAMSTALGVARPGGVVSFVGVPRQVKNVELPLIFARNLTLAGALAPARAYIEELLPDVVSGRLDVTPVLDTTVTLDTVLAGYRAMDERRAVKVMVEVSAA